MERTSHQGNVRQNDHIGTLCLLLLLGNRRDAVDISGALDADCTWISGALDADCTCIIGALDADCIEIRVERSVALGQQIIVVTFFSDAWCTQNISGNVGVRPRLFILHCMNSRRG